MKHVHYKYIRIHKYNIFNLNNVSNYNYTLYDNFLWSFSMIL